MKCDTETILASIVENFEDRGMRAMMNCFLGNNASQNLKMNLMDKVWKDNHFVESTTENSNHKAKENALEKAYKWLKPRLQPYELEKFKRFMEE